MEIKAILEKPYSETERIDFIVTQNHKNGYDIKETETALEAWGPDETEELEQAKQLKYTENETIRDTFLLSGVTYKNIVFDSDTDQKINLMYAVESMGDEDTIEWVGIDGVSKLECTKVDLLNIGKLITATTSYVWQYRNPQIKKLIEEAETIEEVEAIEITYELPENVI